MVSWHPYIVEDDEFKTLQFARLDIQSRMRKSAPNELVLSYSQAMAVFMLFIEAPRHILMAGLGGGSLQKFCYQHLPATRITTLEISQEVIDLRNEFCIPADDERFQVICDDFASWLNGRERIADVILLDGFTDIGIPASLSRTPFYRRCGRALTENGMVVANINLGITDDSSSVREEVERGVGPTVSIRSTAGHNDILLAFRRAVPLEVKVLKARAVALRNATGIDFPLLLDKVRSAAVAAPGGGSGA